MKPPENLLARVLFFSVLIVLINSWLLHHFGSGLKQLSIYNAPLMLIAIIKAISQIIGKGVASEIKDRIRIWFYVLLKTRVLVSIYGIILVAGFFISTVTVMSSGVSDRMSVNLTSEGKPQRAQHSKKLNGPNSIVRFHKFVTPFGSSFYLEVESYLRHSFDLYPWIGKKVRVSSDLKIAPSVLIRIPVEAHIHLRKGKIMVVSNNTILAEKKTNENQGSILVGHYFPADNEIGGFVEKWKMELDGKNIKGAPAAQSLLAWQHFQKVSPCVSIIPDMNLEVKFFIEENKPIASSKFRVGYEKIQEILLSSVKEE